MWPWPTWKQIKTLASTYYSGMYQGAKSVAKETYHGIKQVATHPIESVKSLASNPGRVLKAGISKSVNLTASAGALPLIAAASVKTGDATVAGQIAGKVLTTAAIEGGTSLATEGAGNLVRNLASKAGGTAAKVAAGASEGVDYGKILSSTSEFDPVKTLYRGTTGSETKSSNIFLTDSPDVASTYTKNGGQVMEYDISSSGLYKLQYTGEVDIYNGINQGSNIISTEYKFIGKDLVKAINEKAKPHNP